MAKASLVEAIRELFAKEYLRLPSPWPTIENYVATGDPRLITFAKVPAVVFSETMGDVKKFGAKR